MSTRTHRILGALTVLAFLVALLLGKELVVFLATEPTPREDLLFDAELLILGEREHLRSNIVTRGRRGRLESKALDWLGYAFSEYHYGTSSVVAVRLKFKLSGEYLGCTAWRPSGEICLQYIEEADERRTQAPWEWGETDQSKSTSDCRYALLSDIGEWYMIFDHHNLTGFDFSHATLHNMSFRGANLDGSVFTGAELDDSDLNGVRAVGAVFDYAVLAGVNFGRADVTGASFQSAILDGADMSSCLGLVPGQVRGASSWLGVKLPERSSFDEFRD